LLIRRSQPGAGRIYGNTLDKLADVGDQPAPPSLKKADIQPLYANAQASPYIYDPYPDYNSDAWKAENHGTYRPCHGPENFVADSVVFRGKSEAFNEPGIGSYNVLQMDSMICIERDTWLDPYATKAKSLSFWGGDSIVDWDEVNWKALHDSCLRNNSDRFALHMNGRSKEASQSIVDTARGHSRDFPANPSDSIESTRLEPTVEEADVEVRASTSKRKSRTALLLRAYSGIKFTENDKRTIRALINELSLKSGGEYEVFFLMQIKHSTLSKEAAHRDLPKEFWDMAVVWNDEQMAKLYPKIPQDVNRVHVSQWFSVQKFALDYPEFDYYWNWELDSRFVGNHYDLLEKLSAFAAKQPRKGLWERNERYYIPAVHGDYDTTFRHSVERAHGDDTIWGPVVLEGVTPVGPRPPVPKAKEDNYEWGVGEDADYISLGPMFDPVNASWIDLNSVWGYQGSENTPRRATIGTQSRCSKKLLLTMHDETVKGNHIGSEMTPQSVSLLHGLKAVYAPIPVFFDRAWSPESLNKYFNPGPTGESGSTMLTPYGWGLEERFEGSTWYYRTSLPMKLYNNFLGWEDSGIGGEKVCCFILIQRYDTVHLLTYV
jgi:hypothetical protein